MLPTGFTDDNPYAAPTAPVEALEIPGHSPPFSSLAWRVLAFIVDYLLLVGIGWGLFALLMIALGYGPPPPFGRLATTKALGTEVTGPLYLILWVLYFSLQESSVQQATFGKRLCRLRVVRVNNEPISFGRAVSRSVVKFLGLVALYMGWLLALLMPRRQALHDIVVGTIVVRVPVAGSESSNAATKIHALEVP